MIDQSSSKLEADPITDNVKLLDNILVVLADILSVDTDRFVAIATQYSKNLPDTDLKDYFNRVASIILDSSFDQISKYQLIVRVREEFYLIDEI